VLWILWNCGSTVPTAYDYYGKEEKTDGRDEWLNYLSAKPGQAQVLQIGSVRCPNARHAR
jgi:hypothetical protein